nr:hypothetical protein [Nitrosomonas nitrosa]
MSHISKTNEAGQSIFLSSVTGLANTLAVVITFFGAPSMYGKSIELVQRFTAAQYGSGFEGLVSLAWFASCVLITFYVSRASISTALIVGGLAVATRLF